MRTLMWFREQDLRIHDNTALYHAMTAAKDGMLAVFIISTEEWTLHDVSPLRQDLILREVEILKKNLQQLNVALWIESIDSSLEIPRFLLKLAETYRISTLYFNEQYEYNESQRDQKIRQLFLSHNLAVKTYTDQVIFNPGTVLTQKNHFFKVFTPFKKVFLEKLKKNPPTLLPLPKKLPIAFLEASAGGETTHTLRMKINIPSKYHQLWPAGEEIAKKKLEDFLRTKLRHYEKDRDFPAVEGTSKLSPYLALGVISIRECFLRARQVAHHASWINELIWREFYKHILYNFPRVSMNKPFHLYTENIRWENNKSHFNAWKKGETGIPIVDAAMRQLLDTGWMHNRLRMITAMFLTKNLLIDWRWGEKYFMQHLIDGDLAANNGGWQWAASTGTDAVPYFRIFNPLLQTARFDPAQHFIKKYCPEYFTGNSPPPIVDLAASRQKARAVFKALSQ